MSSVESDRRRFIKKSAALAAWAAVGKSVFAKAQEGGMAVSGATELTAADPSSAYGARSSYVTTVRISSPPEDPFGQIEHLYSPIQDSVGFITPSPLHYVMAHAPFMIPDINPAQHRFMIHGMVDHPLIFTMDDLKRFPSVTRPQYLECTANKARPEYKTVQRAAGLTSTSLWTGVPLSLLLKEAGVHNGAKWIIAEGSENNKGAMTLPLSKAMDDMLVAYGQNGEPIRPMNGFPLRLLAPGFEGICNVKWLRRVKVVDQFYGSFNEFDRYTSVDPKTLKPFPFQQGPKSAITFPSGDQKLPEPGHYQITGLAWSGGGAVRKLELSTDGGRTWKDAELQSAVYRFAHTRFGMDWNWDGKACVIMSRCTDELGQTQPTVAEFAAHFEQTPERLFSEKMKSIHHNYILPWRIDGDGNVKNGLV